MTGTQRISVPVNAGGAVGVRPIKAPRSKDGGRLHAQGLKVMLLATA